MLAKDGELDQVELPLERTSRLAEQVSDHGGQERLRGPPSHVKPSCSTGESAPPTEGALQQGDLVAELGQPCRHGDATEPPDHHHDPCHLRWSTP